MLGRPVLVDLARVIVRRVIVRRVIVRRVIVRHRGRNWTR
jgi:hypothetical protein